MRVFAELRCVFEEMTLALTPALSPGEREKRFRSSVNFEWLGLRYVPIPNQQEAAKWRADYKQTGRGVTVPSPRGRGLGCGRA
jgi:hypothetical protein